MIEQKLTPKQQKFADYYIETGNATESAIRAGYSKRSARQIGEQNLSKHDIAAYIDERMKQLQSERIADYCIELRNSTQAAVEAGYSEKNSERNGERKPHKTSRFLLYRRKNETILNVDNC